MSEKAKSYEETEVDEDTVRVVETDEGDNSRENTQ